MSVPVIQTAFASGEISPSLFGHVDLAKYHSAASTMRNMFVSYRGGAYSRAGTALVGISKQVAANPYSIGIPPRLITFQFSINQGLCLEFGDHYMRVIDKGAFVLDTPTFTITNITQANPAVVTTSTAHGFSSGDWIYFNSASTMLNINGGTFVAHYLSPTTFSLENAYGQPVSSIGFLPFIYSSPTATVARIYTFTTPYAASDLEYLKTTQSANTMTICCVNLLTGIEYPPYDLVRGASNNSWTLTEAIPAAAIQPPASIMGRATTTTSSSTAPTVYQYAATAVDAITGEESTSSPIAVITDSVEIDVTAGSEVITCSPVAGASYYNFYKAPPAYNVYDSATGYSLITSGSLFGFVGTSYGTTFVDNNITADYATVPPLHNNPFARGQILTINTTSVGDPVSAVSATINTITGAGFAGYAVIGDGGVFQNFVVTNSGFGYSSTDTITLVPTFISGSIAPTASLVIGPQSGTYPAVPGYFQERRVFASTTNNPDTLWMSQSGNFNNFDSRVPPIDTDSIVATPWSVQVNGVQWMVPMPSGLVVLTGLSAWQVTGAGSSIYSVQPITPSGVSAQPQAYNGISATVPPIRNDFDIFYVQAKGSVVRDLSYQFFQNIYTGTDLTQLSSHLFTNHTIKQWAWCEEPYKVIWAVRDDGVMLSLTILKQQEVLGWARHDTQGKFISVCAVTEPPVDALYCCVLRNIAGAWTYFIERMDNRLWTGVESTWCVDCGISVSPTVPQNTYAISSDANLIIDNAYGLGAIAGTTGLVGGSGYSSSTYATVVDDNGNGPGTGALITPNIASGVVVSLSITAVGSGYLYPQINIIDPAGSGTGASATLTLDNTCTLNCYPVSGTPSSALADLPIGTVIRGGGGICITTTVKYVNADGFDTVLANVVAPFTNYIPGSASTPNGLTLLGTSGPLGNTNPAIVGQWNYSTPVTTVYGLNDLAGMTVTGLCDGQVLSPQVVSAEGTITVPSSSSIVVGLGFQAQLQSVYLDAGSPTVQGQRKKISAVTARLESSLGVAMGANQPDGSVNNPPLVAPIWRNMQQITHASMEQPYGTLQPIYPYTTPQLGQGAAVPLYTGDVRNPVPGGFRKQGQVALQQNNPLPMNVLALVPEVWVGDTPQTEARPRQQGNR